MHIDASDYAIGAMLGQKLDSVEHAIYYVSKNIQGAEFNYTATEKELLAVIYALNKFRHYIRGYQIFVHIDHSVIKYLMNKLAMYGHLARWLLLMQEFDITIIDKPGKENVVADFLSQLHTPNDLVAIEDSFLDEHLFLLSTKNPWYANIANYLTIGKTPPHFSAKERWLLAKKSFNFSWISGFMFYNGPDQVTRRCLREDETYDILHAYHDELYSGHFASKRTTFKILNTGYYWPTLHKDATQYTKKCDKFQRMGWPMKMDERPLQPQIIVAPSDKWGIDFVSPIEPSLQGKSYILVYTNYVTKWAEAKLMKHPRDNNVANFLYEFILTQFGVPQELQSDQGPQFTSNLIVALMEEYKIHHGKSSPYYSQANRQVEVTNHELEAILTKRVSLNKKDWVARLLEALWAYRTAWKSTT